MRILITGATGFIGRRLTAQLIDRFGARALACIVHTPRTAAETAAAAAFQRAGVTLLEGDLTRTPVSEAPPPAVDLVFHLAGNIDTSASEDQLRVNDAGMASLLAWLRPVSRGCRIVYTSSVAVLDRSGPTTGPLHAGSPCTPRTAYGVTKLRGEAILRDAAERDGFEWTIVRLPTVYGPGQKPGGLFDLLISSARTGGLISRLNWPGRTSILFVDDAAAILIGLATHPSEKHQICCVSSGEEVTLADIAREAGALLNRPPKPIRLPGMFWRAARRVAWNPVVRGMVPRSAYVAYWRLTLVLDDGFWYGARNLLTNGTLSFVTLHEGLQQTIEAILQETLR